MRLCRSIAVLMILTAARGAAQGEEPTLEERGEYLAHHVAMCVVCHSPRDRAARPLAEQLFLGAPVSVKPLDPSTTWAARAPRIAGLAGWSDEEIILLLTEGKTSRGWSPRPPMPRFRLNRDDAQAIVVYLRSLRPR